MSMDTLTMGRKLVKFMKVCQRVVHLEIAPFLTGLQACEFSPNWFDKDKHLKEVEELLQPSLTLLVSIESQNVKYKDLKKIFHDCLVGPSVRLGCSVRRKPETQTLLTRRSKGAHTSSRVFFLKLVVFVCPRHHSSSSSANSAFSRLLTQGNQKKDQTISGYFHKFPEKTATSCTALSTTCSFGYETTIATSAVSSATSCVPSPSKLPAQNHCTSLAPEVSSSESAAASVVAARAENEPSDCEQNDGAKSEEGEMATLAEPLFDFNIFLPSARWTGSKNSRRPQKKIGDRQLSRKEKRKEGSKASLPGSSLSKEKLQCPLSSSAEKTTLPKGSNQAAPKTTLPKGSNQAAPKSNSKGDSVYSSDSQLPQVPPPKRMKQNSDGTAEDKGPKAVQDCHFSAAFLSTSGSSSKDCVTKSLRKSSRSKKQVKPPLPTAAGKTTPPKGNNRAVDKPCGQGGSPQTVVQQKQRERSLSDSNLPKIVSPTIRNWNADAITADKSCKFVQNSIVYSSDSQLPQVPPPKRMKQNGDGTAGDEAHKPLQDSHFTAASSSTSEICATKKLCQSSSSKTQTQNKKGSLVSGISKSTLNNHIRSFTPSSPSSSSSSSSSPDSTPDKKRKSKETGEAVCKPTANTTHSTKKPNHIVSSSEEHSASKNQSHTSKPVHPKDSPSKKLFPSAKCDKTRDMKSSHSEHHKLGAKDKKTKESKISVQASESSTCSPQKPKSSKVDGHMIVRKEAAASADRVGLCAHQDDSQDCLVLGAADADSIGQQSSQGKGSPRLHCKQTSPGHKDSEHKVKQQRAASGDRDPLRNISGNSKTSPQNGQCRTVLALSDEELERQVLLLKDELKAVYRGELYSERRSQYMQGGCQRRQLDHQVHLQYFREGQEDVVMDILLKIFQHAQFDFKALDFMMRVILPEALLRVYKQVTGMSWEGEP